MTDIRCSECARGFIYGCCGYSYHNAACLTQARRWNDEPQDKLLDYIHRCIDYEDKRYEEEMARLRAWEARINAMNLVFIDET